MSGTLSACSDDCKPPRRLAASRATASIDCKAESALRGESGVVLLEDEAAAIVARGGLSSASRL